RAPARGPPPHSEPARAQRTPEPARGGGGGTARRAPAPAHPRARPRRRARGDRPGEPGPPPGRVVRPRAALRLAHSGGAARPGRPGQLGGAVDRRRHGGAAAGVARGRSRRARAEPDPVLLPGDIAPHAARRAVAPAPHGVVPAAAGRAAALGLLSSARRPRGG